MDEFKYKVGDTVYVTSNNCQSTYEGCGKKDIISKDKEGVIEDIQEDSYHYLVVFKERIDIRYSIDQNNAYMDWFKEKDIMNINSLKLKLLLKD